MEQLASPLTIFTMAVNFTLGAGVLGLPFAMATAGLVASAASLVVVGVLSLLTCSWLLEVGDRANALQNELARSAKQRTVQHANGEVSVLPPASDFCRSSALSEPLLEKGERKLDEYRAAYRSWRTGSHQGVRSGRHNEYMKMNLYDSSKHRRLLPLQLAPARASNDTEEADGSSFLPSPTQTSSKNTPLFKPSRSAMTSAGASFNSLDSDGLTLPASVVGQGQGQGQGQGKPPEMKRNASFSVELAAALQDLPDSYFDVAEEVSQVYVAPSLPDALVPSFLVPPADDPAAAAFPGAARTSPTQHRRTSPAVQRRGSPAQQRRASGAVVPTVRSPQGSSASMADALSSWLQPSAKPAAVAAAADAVAADAACSAPVAPATPATAVAISLGVAAEEAAATAGGDAANAASERTRPDRATSLYLSPGGDGEAQPPPKAKEAKDERRRERKARLPDWSVPADISALEVTQLCNLFLGWRARSVWILSICSLHLAAMWACVAIWTTCAQAVLGGAVNEHSLLLLCAAVLLPLCTLGGTSVVQPPLAVATLATLALMIALLLLGLCARYAGFEAVWPVFDTPAAAPVPPLVDVGAFGPAFATFLFSFILQQSVPSLVRAAALPSLMRASVGAAIATCCALYLLLGTAAALLFGARTAPLITLNFANFRGGAPPGVAPPLWATLVSRWIMVLPLLTTTAAFPLFNNVLASNLVGLLPPGRLRSLKVAAALCALPPLLCAAVLRDTAFLFSLCGLSGFAIVFFVPAALQRAAMRASVRRWGEAGRVTPHTTSFSYAVPVLGVSVFAGAAFVFNCYLVLIKPVVAALASRML